VSEERVGKVSETYRGIRNALRYQLSNLYDFDPAKHTVTDENRVVMLESRQVGTTHLREGESSLHQILRRPDKEQGSYRDSSRMTTGLSFSQ